MNLFSPIYSICTSVGFELPKSLTKYSIWYKFPQNLPKNSTFPAPLHEEKSLANCKAFFMPIGAGGWKNTLSFLSRF